MDGLRQELFSGSALAQQQHGDIGGCNPLQAAKYLQNPRAVSDDPIDRRSGAEPRELAVFCFELMEAGRAFYNHGQRVNIDRLLAEIVSASANRLDRILAQLVAADDDDLCFRRYAE